MTISIISAMARNRVIGVDNDLPWTLPRDMRRFKQKTLGHHLIMGRKTYESLQVPLPNRPLIVLTRNPDYRPRNARVAHSMDEALQLVENDDEVFIAGGENIYREGLKVADRLYLTLVEGDFEGDAYFPEFDLSRWKLVNEERYDDPEATCPFRFLDYLRLRADQV
ncbi:MAG TPA: dihydrofolate reductase [Acidobacteriota bacterium]|nr:dihydrofolate reductase [Acidobacteriota bacterium]